MKVSDLPANGEAKTRALRFRREERLEEVAAKCRRKARSLVEDLDDHCVSAVAASNHDSAPVGHSLDSVLEQIQEELDQLTAIAHYGNRVVRQFEGDGDATFFGGWAVKCDHVDQEC